ncbi:MAG: Stp1/IreP family PP2C-type Ser/Thr phosphatase [Bacillota bacterium]
MPARGLTHLGLVRARNEDYFYMDVARGLYVVADGMGGHQAGDVASRLAADTIGQYINCHWDAPGELLKKAILQANQAVYQEALRVQANHGMGTTVAIALIADGRLFSAHVGDSRIYLIRQDQVTILTSDHSFVGELVKRGELTEADAMGHPQRNILTRALGVAPQVEIDTGETFLFPGDHILLCSDGLSGVVGKEELGQIIRQEADLEQSLNSMIKLALDRGGLDNITAVLVRYE